MPNALSNVMYIQIHTYRVHTSDIKRSLPPPIIPMISRTFTCKLNKIKEEEKKPPQPLTPPPQIFFRIQLVFPPPAPEKKDCLSSPSSPSPPPPPRFLHRKD